jgi:hypothetical protein
MADVELFALRPAGHHASSMLLHLANGILLFGVLRKMTGNTWRSALVAALFLVHPLHVESVAWVSERKDVLSAFFGILTLWAYLRYAERPGVVRYLAVALGLAVGLMAKPMLVTLPLAFLLLDYWPLGRVLRRAGGPAGAPVGQLCLEKVPLLLLSAAAGAATYVAQSSGGSLFTGNSFPLSARAANAVIAYVRYLGKTLWPRNLSPWYPLPTDGYPLWEVCAAGALLVFLSTVVIWQLCRRPYLGIGWFWYLGTLVPVIGIVQVGLQAMADRYTYFPHVGLFVALVWGSAEVVGRRPGRRAVAAVAGAAVLVGLAFVTWRQVPHWRDETSLYGRAVAAVPGNWFMIYNLGTALEKQGHLKEAAARYEEVLRLRPSHADAHFNLGVILGNLGQSEASISHYRAALHIRPDDADTHNNLAAALLARGQLEEAATQFREALRLRPDHPQARMGIRRALAQSPGRR